MVRPAISLGFACSLALLVFVAPPASAQPADVCVATFLLPCTVACGAGDVLAIDVVTTSGSLPVGAAFACGDDSTWCIGTSACSANTDRTLGTGSTGDCVALRQGEVAWCIVAHMQGGLYSTSCSITVDYDTCAFFCPAGSHVSVTATSTEGGYPSVEGRCGGSNASCQSYLACSRTASSAATRAWGVCHTHTIRTNASCSAA